jgi:hypothetical protein
MDVVFERAKYKKNVNSTSKRKRNERDLETLPNPCFVLYLCVLGLGLGANPAARAINREI